MKKLSTYITLIIGIFVGFYVFFLDRNGYYRNLELTSNPHNSYLVQLFLDDTLGMDDDIATIVWWILFVLFVWSWWSLRNCISVILNKFHKKV